MKKIMLILFPVAIFFGYQILANPYFRGEVMGASAVKKKWGAEKLDLEKFKLGNPETRSKYAFDIISNKSYLGKSVSSIRESFGAPDGFYFIDSYPAYLIQEGQSPKEDTWQLVFKLDANRKVKEVIVHKNCCE